MPYVSKSIISIKKNYKIGLNYISGCFFLIDTQLLKVDVITFFSLFLKSWKEWIKYERLFYMVLLGFI